MIFISGIKSIIIQKNMFCGNKIRLIYITRMASLFCPKRFTFLFLGRVTAFPVPPSLVSILLTVNYFRKRLDLRSTTGFRIRLF